MFVLNKSQIVSFELSQILDNSSLVPPHVPCGDTLFNKRALH